MKNILAALFLSCFLLTACGGDEEVPAEVAEDADAPAKNSKKGKKGGGAAEKAALAAAQEARQAKRDAAEIAQQQGGVLILGDSLSAGDGLSSDQAWPGLMRKRLTSSSGVPLVNASISGDTASGGASRVGWQLGKYRPKVVVVALGSRDVAQAASVDSMRVSLDTVIRTVQANKGVVVLAGVRAPSSTPPEYQASVDAMYMDLAKQYQLPFVPDLAAPLARAAQMAPSDSPPANLTLEAQPAIMETVWPAVQEAIRASGASAPAPASVKSKSGAPKK